MRELTAALVAPNPIDRIELVPQGMPTIDIVRQAIRSQGLDYTAPRITQRDRDIIQQSMRAQEHNAIDQKKKRKNLTGGKWLRVTNSELALSAYVILQDQFSLKKYCLEQSSGKKYRVDFYEALQPSGDVDVYLVEIDVLPGEPEKPQGPELFIRKTRDEGL